MNVESRSSGPNKEIRALHPQLMETTKGIKNESICPATGKHWKYQSDNIYTLFINVRHFRFFRICCPNKKRQKLLYLGSLYSFFWYIINVIQFLFKLLIFIDVGHHAVILDYVDDDVIKKNKIVHALQSLKL